MTKHDELIRVVQRLSFCRDLDALMGVLGAAVRELTGADGATVVLRDGDLCYYADENAIAPLWKGKRFPMSACISGWAMLHRQQVAIPDIYADARIPHDAYRPTFVRSLAMTPIRTAEPIGAIGAYWAKPHEPTQEQLDVLTALGDAASTAFTNVELFASLAEASRRKDEFLLMLAHELRNPLGPIRNVAHVLKSLVDGNETAKRAHGVMDRQIAHLGRLVDDLLDAARITRGSIEIQSERVDLARIVADAVQDYRGLIEASGLTLRATLPEVPVWVMGDAVRLAQAVGGLLDNARKFTPAGEVVVRIEDDRDAHAAVVTVRDTGIGIRGDMLTRVFDAFSQADVSLDRTRGGLGLGLSIAKGVAELHGGSLAVASDGEGRGSEFTLRVPREGEPPALEGDARSIGQPARRSRILVVEDNRDAAETLRMVLMINGYDAHVAYTGNAGVDAARTLHPDIVLSDIGLPGMDGYAVARALRSDPSTSSAHLIAITGYGSEDDRARAIAAGFDVHLVKPVPPERLIEELAAIAA